ncbi:hypothetical protein HPS57_11775 [Prevotella sp. PINT]|uniref:hypothetical protein n=1 Tax=Palleniella intestinalis TaxID=2736291 RepID=UPI001555B298|nr:hypothetical protein [Palleniella intestinalis]NPD82644.1 hypothetical protein [Palleniella intestinalis]
MMIIQKTIVKLSEKQKAWSIVAGFAVITAGAGYFVAIGANSPFVFVISPHSLLALVGS